MTATYDENALFGKIVLVSGTYTNGDPLEGPAALGVIRGVTLQPEYTNDDGEYYSPGTWFLVEFQNGRFAEYPSNAATLVK